MLRTLEEAKKSIREKMEKQLDKKLSDSEFEARYQEELGWKTTSLRIPSKYRNVKTTDVPKEVLDCFPLDDEKCGIYLWGGVGVGKTHALYAFQKVMTERLSRFSVANMSELLSDIRSSFDDKNKIDILDEVYTGYDDLGAEKESEWTGEQIYRLVNYFYENKRAFFFTSNLSLGDLAKRCGVQGDRIASRIAEMAHVIELKGTDRRI